jgi:hypothetical protein
MVWAKIWADFSQTQPVTLKKGHKPPALKENGRNLILREGRDKREKER